MANITTGVANLLILLAIGIAAGLSDAVREEKPMEIIRRSL
jgi:hypothetical protein